MQETTLASSFLRGGGEMGDLTRKFDWSKTSIGIPETWPVSLRGYVNMMLSSRFPMMILWGPQLLCLYNDAFRESLGNHGKHPAILGLPGNEAWPETWHASGPQIERLLAGDEASLSEDHLVPIYRNGKMEDAYRTYSHSTLIDDQGTIAGVLLTYAETTKSIKTIGERSESKERSQNLVRPVNAGIAQTDLRGRFLEVNERYCQMLGYSADELMQKTIGDVTHPDDMPQNASLLKTLLEDGRDFLIDKRYIHKDGRQVWVSNSVSLVTDASGVQFITAVSVDHTAQKEQALKLEESEANLQKLVLQAPIGICVMNSATLITEMVNDTYVEIAGKPYEDIYDRYFWDVFPEAAPYYEAALQGVIDSGNAFHAVEVPLMLIRHGKEENLYMTFVYEPLKDLAGNVTKVVVWAVENTLQETARIKIEEVVAQHTKELAEANLLLAQNNRELEQFAYIASHDLQEPLRKVSTFTEMLKTHLGDVDDRSENYFNKINVSTQRMIDLIRDVLDFSQLSSQRQVYEQVDIGVLLENLTTDFELVIEQKGAIIQHRNLPALLANPLQMRQLFSNLLSNALKFTKAGVPPVISISSEPLGDEEKAVHKDLLPDVEYCIISVEDNGVGFDEQHADRIFSIFQRLHGKSEFAGTGIGLALCKKIAQNHHGEIWATSQPGKGTTFHIILPCQQNT